MIVKYYNCEFLSDVVLQASSSTQGNVLLSDFISGNNFLGMVASNGGYASFGDDAFEVFHSGDVRFGDGHIVVDDKPSYKIPLSFFNLKIGEGYYNRIFFSDEEEQRLRNEQKQLKQIRVGFMNRTGSYIVPSYQYTQKSSYDRELRKSEESGMFGYSALEKGTHWIFKVTFKDETHIEKVEKKLLESKRLGKSKSAQYGQIKITVCETLDEQVEKFVPENKLTYIYANARLALIDENGMPTLKPSIKNLGLKSGEINWDKTQIKTVSYNPYNYIRQTKEYTRVALAKGSVIVVENLSNETVPDVVGVYLNEGFGDVLINPKFLDAKEPKLKKYVADKSEYTIENYDKNIVSFLEQKEITEKNKFDVASEVQSVIKSLMGPSRSQWGQIRTFASISSSKEDLIENIKTYIEKGVSKKQWKNNKVDEKLINAIDKNVHPLAFTKLLGMMMPKHTKGGKDDKSI